jgi:hypothetical protein
MKSGLHVLMVRGPSGLCITSQTTRHVHPSSRVRYHKNDSFDHHDPPSICFIREVGVVLLATQPLDSYS